MNAPISLNSRVNRKSCGIRKHITVPGILHEALLSRTREFGHRTFSPFAIDLVCYDLRSNAPHRITLAICNETQSAQDAVDAELVARYRPSQVRNGLLVQIVEHLNEERGVARFVESPPPLSKKPERITFPGAIWPLADLRWRELGYANLSTYITGLIRYDFLVGGPHLFNSSDKRPEILSALDEETIQTRQKGVRRKLFLDHLIERVEGRQLTIMDLQAQKAHVAARLLKAFGSDSASKGSPAHRVVDPCAIARTGKLGKPPLNPARLFNLWHP